jgi:hypothetical protein
MKTTPTKTPQSIDAAARHLRCDRRTLTAALREAGELDFILPADQAGVRESPRWKLCDACEALELWRVRQAPPDTRRWCERRAADEARALAMPCPRCGGMHHDTPILPMPGKQDTPEIMAWFESHGFPMHYPEAGPPHAFC